MQEGRFSSMPEDRRAGLGQVPGAGRMTLTDITDRRLVRLAALTFLALVPLFWAPGAASGQQGSDAKPAAAKAAAPKAAAPKAAAPATDDARKSDPQAVAIVENYLKVIGGRDTLAKIKDRTMKFANVKSGATGDTRVDINVYMKRLGDYAMGLREEWDVKGFDIKGQKLAFTQIYNGKLNKGWVLMMKTVSSLDGKTLQVFVWDKYIDDFFVDWKDSGYTLKMAGQGIVTKEMAGSVQPCDVIKVTDFSGRQTSRYFFSRNSGLLVKKEWQEAGTNARAKVKKEQYYKSYHDLPFMDNSGLSIKFPLRLEIYLDGDLDTVRDFGEVVINKGLSDKLFGKPPGKPFDKAVFSAQARQGQKKGPAASGTTEPKTPAVGPQHGRRKPGLRKLTPLKPAPKPAPGKDEPPPPAKATPPAGSGSESK